MEEAMDGQVLRNWDEMPAVVVKESSVQRDSVNEP